MTVQVVHGVCFFVRYGLRRSGFFMSVYDNQNWNEKGREADQGEVLL